MNLIKRRPYRGRRCVAFGRITPLTRVEREGAPGFWWAAGSCVEGVDLGAAKGLSE